MTKDFFIDVCFENAVVELYTICYNITDVVLNMICHTYNLYFTRYILYKYSSKTTWCKISLFSLYLSFFG